MIINTNITKYQAKQKLRNLLLEQNYNWVATIQAPMRHKYSFEKRMEGLANLGKVDKMFYSEERNADLLGYHIHLMMKVHNPSKETLAWALDVKKNYIPYLEEIDYPKRLTNYVTKHMKGDQIHYNFY